VGALPEHAQKLKAIASKSPKLMAAFNLNCPGARTIHPQCSPIVACGHWILSLLRAKLNYCRFNTLASRFRTWCPLGAPRCPERFEKSAPFRPARLLPRYPQILGALPDPRSTRIATARPNGSAYFPDSSARTGMCPQKPPRIASNRSSKLREYHSCLQATFFQPHPTLPRSRTASF
jgi:hypothetical protein